MRPGRLLLLIAVLFVIAAYSLVSTVEGPRWNEPQPAIMHLPFPTSEEIAAKRVAATAEERADAMKWIAEFLNPAAMPEGLEEHLLALKDAIPAAHAAVIGSGYPGSPPGGVKMTSGFVVKYESQGYAFQAMETRSCVVLGVQALGGAHAKTSEADRIAFVQDIIQRFTKPQPADPFIIARHLPLATYGAYSPVKQIAGAEGNYALDSEQMSRSAFQYVKFATDGKSVILEAHKNFPLSLDLRPRFAPPAPPSS